MGTIIVKRKEFEVIELISNNISKCSSKNKLYLLYKLDINDVNYREKLLSISRLSHSSVKQPKLKIIDKKQGYIVREYLEGTTIFDYILDHDFNENIYRQVFYNSYSARMAGLNLNFDLKAWTLVGDELYYTDLFVEKYEASKDFTKNQIRLWFLSTELCKYYENNGVLFDKTRLKQEYEVNKEMVLMTCKYYL